MTDVTGVEPENSPKGIVPRGTIGASFRLLFRNYWSFAVLGVVLALARIFIGLLNYIPLLGQVLGIFLWSLVYGLALLAALGIARREASPYDRVGAVLAPKRLLELAVVMVPVGLVLVAATLTRQFFFWTGMVGSMMAQSMLVLNMPVLLAAIVFAMIEAYVLIKVAFSAFFVAAVPPDASAAPFARMRQSMKLSRGRAFGLALSYLLVTILGAFFDLIPIIGSVIIAAALILPLKLAALIVIYHKLIDRPLEGLGRQVRTAADEAADEVKPI